MRQAECPNCCSTEIGALRTVEESGGVFGLEYKDGKLVADVDWGGYGKEAVGGVTFRCLDCEQEVADVRKLIPKESPEPSGAGTEQS